MLLALWWLFMQYDWNSVMVPFTPLISQQMIHRVTIFSMSFYRWCENEERCFSFHTASSLLISGLRLMPFWITLVFINILMQYLRQPVLNRELFLLTEPRSCCTSLHTSFLALSKSRLMGPEKTCYGHDSSKYLSVCISLAWELTSVGWQICLVLHVCWIVA